MHHKAVIKLVVWCAIVIREADTLDNPDVIISNCPRVQLFGVAYDKEGPVMWTVPTATKEGKTITNFVTIPSLEGDPPYYFPVGRHRITYAFFGSGFSKYCSFYVNIYEQVQMVDPPPNKVFISTGESFQIPCQATSSDRVRYSWQKGNIALEQSDRIQWSEDIPGLVIQNAVVEDSGTYTCTAFAANNDGELPVGSTSVRTVLKVSKNLSWTPWSEWSICFSCNEGTRIRQRSCKTPEGNMALSGCDGPSTLEQNCTEACKSEKVRMVDPPSKRVYFPAGNSIQFPCQANSSRGVRYMWTKDDVELKQSDRILWTEDRPGLVIQYTAVEDSGTYTCTAFAANDDGRPVVATSVSTVLEVSENVNWTAWSEWSVCFSCTEGTRIRQRSCETPEGNIALSGCDGPSTLEQNCTEACQLSETPEVYIEPTQENIETPQRDAAFAVAEGQISAVVQNRSQTYKSDIQSTKCIVFPEICMAMMTLMSVLWFLSAVFVLGGFRLFGFTLERKKKSEEISNEEVKSVGELEKLIAASTSNPGENAVESLKKNDMFPDN